MSTKMIRITAAEYNLMVEEIERLKEEILTIEILCAERLGLGNRAVEIAENLMVQRDALRAKGQQVLGFLGMAENMGVGLPGAEEVAMELRVIIEGCEPHHVFSPTEFGGDTCIKCVRDIRDKGHREAVEG